MDIMYTIFSDVTKEDIRARLAPLTVKCLKLVYEFLTSKISLFKNLPLQKSGSSSSSSSTTSQKKSDFVAFFTTIYSNSEMYQLAFTQLGSKSDNFPATEEIEEPFVVAEILEEDDQQDEEVLFVDYPNTINVRRRSW